MGETILHVQGVSKSFNRITVLENINMNIHAGEVHVLVGENGAGKSTLVNIISGLLKPDGGKIFLKGEEICFKSPIDALQQGISVIHQELNLVDKLDVARNVFLGKRINGQGILQKLGFIKWNLVYNDARDALKLLGVDIDPATLVKNLGTSEKQVIEICRALSAGAQVILMDEPTSSLSVDERRELFEKIRSLKARGVAILYISHFLDEIFEIGDRVTVLRDGKMVGTHDMKETTRDGIIQMMIGRKIQSQYPRPKKELSGKLIFKVKDYKAKGLRAPADLEVGEGEILGIFGLVGAGRTELARALFGADQAEEGEMWLEGKPVKVHSPVDAINHGIALLTEDRKGQGLHLGLSIEQNNILAALNKRETKKEITRYLGFIRKDYQHKLAQGYIEQLRIKAISPVQLVKFLSGGNQQKVVLAKWLCSRAKVIIFDEPTRGVDVGAKVEIYNIIHELARQGRGVVMISSELPEVMGISDRIMVMCKGRISGEVNYHDATKDNLMKLATKGGY
ncbi:MAG: sugar ABC transporter ATP-binding protein [Eubacteriales bacterium]